MAEEAPRNHVMLGIAQLREEGLLYDIELQAENKTISAHKLLLAAVSPYFKTLFTGGFREEKQSVITLKEVEFESLKTTIDFLYSQHLDITNDNVAGLFATASMLQMSNISLQCETFCRSNMSDDTCIRFLKLAQTYEYELRDLATELNSYILDNFVSVRKTDDFKRISKDALISYINDPELNTDNNEAETYYAAKDWVEFDEERLQFTTEIMSKVRFKLIKYDALIEMGISPLIMNHTKGISELIRCAIHYREQFLEKPLDGDEQCLPRGRQGFFTLYHDVGTPEWKGSTKTVADVCSIEDGGSWTAPLNGVGLFIKNSLTGVQVNNFFFVFAMHRDSFLPVSLRFDATCSEWVHLAPIPSRPTVWSCAARVEADIFLLGGMYIDDSSPFAYANAFSSRTYKYNVLTNSWEKMDNIPRKICNAAATSLDSCVYVSGGFRSEQAEAVNTVYAFDTKSSKWIKMPSMKHARGEHCTEAVGDKLYVFGGTSDGRASQRVHHSETFNIKTQQWTVIKNQSVRCFRSTSLAHNGKIYLFGGTKMVGRAMKLTNLIRVFDTKTRKLSFSDIKLPNDQSQAVSGLLTFAHLPKRKRVTVQPVQNASDTLPSGKIKCWLCKGLGFR